MAQSDTSIAASWLVYGQAVRAIFVGGFVVGVLDLAYAILVYTGTCPEIQLCGHPQVESVRYWLSP